MKNQIIESFKKFLGEAMNDEVVSQISDHIDEIASTKAEEKIKELNKKIKEKDELLKKKEEEIRKLKAEIEENEKIFKEEAEEFAYEMAESFAIKEQIMFEEVENFKIETLKAIEESAAEYRQQVEKIVEDVANEYKTKIEEIALEEAKNFRIQQEAALAKDVESYRKELLDKIDQYLEAEIPKHIPQGLLEAAAKSKAYEGLVNGILETFSRNYIKVDSTGYEALKEAQKKVEAISEQYNAKVKEAVVLTAKVRDLEKKVKIAELTEGLTRKQKEKVVKLLENVHINDLENKFKDIIELVIQENAEPAKVTSKQPFEVLSENKHFTNSPTRKTNENYVSKQLEIIESQGFGTSNGYVINEQIQQWKKTLDRLNKRI